MDQSCRVGSRVATDKYLRINLNSDPWSSLFGRNGWGRGLPCLQELIMQSSWGSCICEMEQRFHLGCWRA